MVLQSISAIVTDQFPLHPLALDKLVPGPFARRIMPGYMAANVAARKYGVSKGKLPKITFHSSRNSRKKRGFTCQTSKLCDFSRLCGIVRFSVNCAKSHHRVMSDALTLAFPQNQYFGFN